jgi:hypothetical protein
VCREAFNSRSRPPEYTIGLEAGGRLDLAFVNEVSLAHKSPIIWRGTIVRPAQPTYNRHCTLGKILTCRFHAK